MFSGHISHGIRCRKNGSRNLAVWVLSPEAEVRRKITAEMLARLEPKLRVKKISEHQTWPEIGNSWISGKKVGCSLVVFFLGGSFQLLLFGKGDKFEDKCLLSLFRCIYIYIDYSNICIPFHCSHWKYWKIAKVQDWESLLRSLFVASQNYEIPMTKMAMMAMQWCCGCQVTMMMMMMMMMPTVYGRIPQSALPPLQNTTRSSVWLFFAEPRLWNWVKVEKLPVKVDQDISDLYGNSSTWKLPFIFWGLSTLAHSTFDFLLIFGRTCSSQVVFWPFKEVRRCCQICTLLRQLFLLELKVLRPSDMKN